MGKRQCELAGCSKWIAAGGTPHCVAHGCQEEDCIKGAATGGTPHCKAHGGKRFQEEDRLYGVKFVATPSQPRSLPCHGNRV